MNGSRRSAEAGQKQNDKKSQPSKKIVVITAVLVVCVIAGLTSRLWGDTAAANWAKGMFVEEGKVVDGTLNLKEVASIGTIPDGEVRFYINKNVVFDNTYAKGSIIIQNPSQCEFILQFKFFVVDEFGKGELVYTSDKIKPGQYLNGDKLDSRLFEGKYNGTYTVLAYELDDPDTIIGETSGFLTIIVEN